MKYISPDVDLLDAVILHPLVNEEQLYHLHNMSLVKEFNETLAKMMMLKEGSLYGERKKGRILNMIYYDSSSLYSISPFTYKLPRHDKKSKDEIANTSHHLAVGFDGNALHCVTQSATVSSCHTGMVLPSVILSLHVDKYVTKVNFILPVTSLMPSFQRFMIDFESSFLSRSTSRRVSLLMVLFTSHPVTTNDNIFASSTLVELYQRKYPEADVRLVRTSQPLSWREVYHQTLLEYSTLDLLFFANTFTKFSIQFIDNCISNTVDGHQVYFPSLFSPFDPVSYQKSYLINPYANRLPIDLSIGSWLSSSPHTACVFASDLVSLLERGKDHDDISLMDGVLSHELLSVFSAPEVGAVHLWRRQCREDELSCRLQDIL